MGYIMVEPISQHSPLGLGPVAVFFPNLPFAEPSLEVELVHMLSVAHLFKIQVELCEIGSNSEPRPLWKLFHLVFRDATQQLDVAVFVHISPRTEELKSSS